MAVPRRKLVTYAEYAAAPDDGRRYELLEGRLDVVPSPGQEHQRVAFRLARLLADHVEKNNLGEVYIAPFDVLLGDHDAPQPDVLFVSRANAGRASSRGVEGPPDLAVEVLSPSSRSRDWVRKQRVYAKNEVPEYWVVDPSLGTVDVLVLEASDYEPREAASGDTPIPSRLFPELPFLPRDIFPAK